MFERISKVFGHILRASPPLIKCTINYHWSVTKYISWVSGIPNSLSGFGESSSDETSRRQIPRVNIGIPWHLIVKRFNLYFYKPSIWALSVSSMASLSSLLPSSLLAALKSKFGILYYVNKKMLPSRVCCENFPLKLGFRKKIECKQ